MLATLVCHRVGLTPKSCPRHREAELTGRRSTAHRGGGAQLTERRNTAHREEEQCSQGGGAQLTGRRSSAHREEEHSSQGEAELSGAGNVNQQVLDRAE